MRYYVTTDVHGYFTELKNALTEKGFFEDTQPHKLLICGDAFDRGQEAVAMQEFLLDLLYKEQLILIRGNHEDLMEKLLHQWNWQSYAQRHHWSNGTVNTVCQLTGFSERDVFIRPEAVGRALLHTQLYRVLIPATRNYFETDRYIFVHGWIPCEKVVTENDGIGYVYRPDWRNATQKQWEEARWCNGMEAAHWGVFENEKTIVCGHWNCSFGHSHYHGQGSEFDEDAKFDPYYDEGIIALDACTAYSGKVNCIVIED